MIRALRYTSLFSIYTVTELYFTSTLVEMAVQEENLWQHDNRLKEKCRHHECSGYKDRVDLLQIQTLTYFEHVPHIRHAS